MTERMTAAEYQKQGPLTRPKGKQLEGIIKRQIKAYLQLQGWCTKYIIQSALSEPGLPDILCFKEGRVVMVEVKTPTGKLSEHQKAFQAECEREGVTYIVARGIAEVECLGDRQLMLTREGRDCCLTGPTMRMTRCAGTEGRE